MNALDIVDFEDKVKEYIENTFPAYLGELAAVDEYTDDFIDLDKHRKAVTVFYDFASYSFDELSNMSRDETCELHVFFALRGAKEADLRDNARKYASAFYNFFYDDGDSDSGVTVEEYCNRNFAGLVDTGIVQTVAFYDAAEGNTNIKIAELTLSLKMED